MSEQSEEPRPRMDLQKLESWVDQTIQQAQRRGDFDNLPGAGRPLADLDKPYDPDWWVKKLVEREKLDLSAAMPGVLALRRERQGYPESLVAMADEEQVRARLTDFNERVLADRRKPVAGPASPPVVGRVDVEGMVVAWRRLRAERVPAPPVVQAPVEPGELQPASQPRGWWRRRRRRA